MKRLWSNLGENRKHFALTLVVAIVYAANSVALPTVSGNLITAVITDFSKSAGLLVLFIAVSLFQIFCSQLNLYMGNNLKIRQKKLMRQKAFRSFSENDVAGREEQAGFTSFINNDIPSVAEQYFLGTVDIVNCICIILFSAASLLYIHWLFALIIIGISCLIVYLPKTLRKRGGEARKSYSDAMAQYNTIMQSFLGGLRILKTYQYHNRANQLLHDSNEDVVKREKVMMKQQLIVYGMTTCLQVFKTISILCIGAVMVYKGIVEVGGLITIIQLAELIGAPIEVLAYLHHSRNEVLPLLEKYEEMTSSNDGCLEKTDISNVNPDAIILDQVSYRIGELQILKDVSVKFSVGKKYLITGASGSGKSTLLRLISRIGDSTYNGQICYGGTEIRDIDMIAYFCKVCPVFQEPYLFHATLEENILLGRQIESSIYYDVIERLNLKYLLERYEGQELTPAIMELLSGGEKQRVALARAMVGKPQVYLLDEVTSALDKENAYNIEELLLKENAMVIHISHKASGKLAAMYDEHFVLEEGMLSAQGNIAKTH